MQLPCPKCGNRDVFCYFKDYFDTDDEGWWFLFDNECPECGLTYESIRRFIETPDDEKILDYDGTLYSKNRKLRRRR